MTARKLALDLLVKCERSKQYSNISLDNALLACDLSDADKALCCALFMGVIERKITLDYYISLLSSREIERIDAPTLSIIRMGLYQLIYMDKIPPHAAVNESVSLGSRASAGFINAILRAYLRESERLALPSRDDDSVHYLSVCYSVCEPLAKKFIDVFGLARAESILSACYKAPKTTTLRANTLKCTRDELAKRIEGAQLSSLAPNALRVSGSVRDTWGYGDGAFFVQDEASQICVGALDAREGDTVIDACSAPGSKSFGAAIDMKNTGRVLSFDLHANKLSLIREGAERLGISIIETAQADARTPIPHLFGIADRVLCDVPCSGFGVLAKKGELRYKDPAESARLPEIQAAILENCSSYVKEGGTLVYSTCTVFPEENRENIERFLACHKEFSLCPFEFGGVVSEDGTLSLMPDTHGCDGFFVAKLKKAN